MGGVGWQPEDLGSQTLPPKVLVSPGWFLKALANRFVLALLSEGNHEGTPENRPPPTCAAVM